MLLENFQDSLFKASIRNKKYVIGFFVLIYSLIILILLLGVYPMFAKGKIDQFYYSLGVWSGRAALLMLSLTVFPGILGRFNIKIPITFVITRYRRQFGITVFLLAFTHYFLINLGPQITKIYPLMLWPGYLFMQLSLIALVLLFLMFITSNSWSVLHLKKWWKRLHRVVYIILWLILFHVYLQNKTSFWTIWIGSIAVLETASLIYHYLIRKEK